MDHFGVLVESIGFKAHGKSSAPLADLKNTNKPNFTSNGFPTDIGSNSTSKPPNSDFDDMFGVFNPSKTYNDDVFGVFKGSSGDVVGNRDSVDDLLGSFGGMGVHGNLNANVMMKKQETVSQPTDLLSDFASSLNRRKAEANPAVGPAKSFSATAVDPFLMFESGGYQVNNGASGVDDYLDSLFTSGAQSNTRSTQSSTNKDSVYDALFNNNVVPKKQNKAVSTKQASSSKAANSSDDFSYLFGMGVAPPSGEFQEIEGESEERRKARFNHHMTTRERMNNALNEKNKRDLQAQQEQDEKHRVAATLEGDIKRWAVGKEGNLRALLSSLQHILWAGSGWQPISLTDLITSTAVKKAYFKATLCVHPDKVQQKGASVQQKYIAEKVFDLLKESWNKFNAEEFKKQ
ncbi:putative Chaperone J-domain superfamily [Helianthus debilis subsp. tardiflorus]